MCRLLALLLLRRPDLYIAHTIVRQTQMHIMLCKQRTSSCTVSESSARNERASLLLTVSANAGEQRGNLLSCHYNLPTPQLTNRENDTRSRK